MPGWSLSHCSLTGGGRTFQRPLDVTEVGFLWDSAFNGTADSLQHIQLRLLNQNDTSILSQANIVRTWQSVKRRYPLLGARVETGIGEPRFVVQEHRLMNLNPGELVFDKVSSPDEVLKLVTDILDGPRPLSNDLLAQVYIFHRTDRADVIHLFSLIAHCVTDGGGNSSFVRCFLDTLSSRSEAPIPPLEERLSMVISSEELEPKQALSPARRRWRQAIGFVIFQVRMARRQGGHTLPCRMTPSTFRVPARSRILVTSFSPEQTTAIMANCRRNKVTFGNAYLPLAQVAMTRVLYRRYLRGEISEEEWGYRKRQPHISGGPLNLRPYLDKQWLNKGGGGEFMLAISFFFYQLPFMTLGVTAKQRRGDLVLSNGAPPFANLLTFNRFLHRANMVKDQGANFLKHPLFLEIAGAAHVARLEGTRIGALEWMKSVEEGTAVDEGEALAATEIPGAVWAHGGSSIGNMDEVSPTEYPLRSTNPISPRSNIPHPAKAGYITLKKPDTSEDEPKIVIEYSRVHLHTRPAELYLGAATARKQLHLSVFYDGNVYEEAIVREWLDEVRDAVLWYLGQSHLEGGTGQPKL
ncbi:hypothetical protein HYDPIDRAFT_36382 [Hydnomerulius pinastri MD-312]|nr:hypothetical protein HYDPIDRAFT_36382 [Hydnomerulius pinastri MD-312]